MSALLRLCLVLVLWAPALAHAEVLENPSGGNFYSGIGVISGWKCEANGQLTVRFDGGRSIPLLYGSERLDTRSVCGDANNGFVAIWNWARLDDGFHTAVVYDNGVEFDRATFEVATLGEEFVRGAAGECQIVDFPSPGETTPFEWNEATQHFEVVGEDLPTINLGGTDTGTGSSTLTNSTGMEFVRIEPGTFLMGSPASELIAGETLHQVTISRPFYLGKYEVTQAQWETVMGNNPSYSPTACDTCPVQAVSWDDAQEFVRRLNDLESVSTYRLPTEAEWEYAARAGTQTVYHFGDAANRLGEYAWYSDNSDSRIHPVGQKRPNGWGLFDMHGNVSEWVADWYDAYWYDTYPSGSVIDPRGPSIGTQRVYRGGDWGSDPRNMRAASRSGIAPNFKDGTTGFRLARTIP